MIYFKKRHWSKSARIQYSSLVHSYNALRKLARSIKNFYCFLSLLKMAKKLAETYTY